MDEVFDPYETGARIRRLREAGGLRQKDLAARAGLATGTLSMIETGAQIPESEVADALAQILNCTTQYLGRERGPYRVTKPWLRAYADASKRTVDMYVADTATAGEAIFELGLNVIEDRLPTFLGDVQDDVDMVSFA